MNCSFDIFSFVLLLLLLLLLIQSKTVQVKGIYHYDSLKNTNKPIYAINLKSWKWKEPIIVKNIVQKKKNCLFHLQHPQRVTDKLLLLRRNRDISNSNGNNVDIIRNFDKNVKIAQWLKRKKKLTYFYVGNTNTNENGIKKKKHTRKLMLFLENKQLIEKYLRKWTYLFYNKFKRTKNVTKVFVTSSLLITLLNVCGLKPESIALHDKRIIRSFEFYRILTSALFYGDISLYVLTNIYMLYLESQQLEMSLGSSETLSFYLSQLFLLSIFCCYLKKPFYSTALLKSLLFLNCMLRPHQKAQIIFGLKIDNFYLPYLSILIDVLHAQKLNASLSGLLGICSGSIYYILNIYMYEYYNRKIFRLPPFLERYLDSLDSEDFNE